MTIETFATKWFIIYYTVLGMLLFFAGGWLLLVPGNFHSYLSQKAKTEKAPSLLRIILKYWLLFTLPCLVFSIIAFSWAELLFSIWSLFMVYVLGSQLTRWEQLRILIQKNDTTLSFFIRWTGVIMMSAAIVILLLGYLKILQT